MKVRLHKEQVHVTVTTYPATKHPAGGRALPPNTTFAITVGTTNPVTCLRQHKLGNTLVFVSLGF